MSRVICEKNEFFELRDILLRPRGGFGAIHRIDLESPRQEVGGVFVPPLKKDIQMPYCSYLLPIIAV